MGTTFDELRAQTVSMLDNLIQQPSTSDSDLDSSSADAHHGFEYSKVLIELYGTEEDDREDANADVADWRSSELNELQKCSLEANAVLTSLDSSRKALEILAEKYENVALNTSSLHEACEQLMSDQTRLAGAAEEINYKLSYFHRLDQISQKLSSPMLSVTGESFAAILNTIDECVHFLQTETEYKESSAYLSRYQQCLSRALSLVRQHVVASFNVARENIYEKLKEDPSVGEDTFTLYYGMFASHAQTVHSLMTMLESKWDLNDEYQNVLVDCYNAYFTQRDGLIRPSVTATVNEMIKKYSKSCCTLTRTGCSFLLRLCEDEYRLFFQFFTRPTELLHDFLERLCHVFYDSVRPLVIHIPHLENLTELCSILKNEFLEERCSAEPDLYSGFMAVGTELLGDVGEKLVFRAHTYAHSDILNYTPAPGDLAYPEKLLMMQDIAKSTARQHQQEEKDQQELLERSGSVESGDNTVAGLKKLEKNPESVSAADLHGLWYPTVRRTVLTLSKLYRCLDLAVFQGLCQDVLNMCVQSLKTAQQKINQIKRPLDGQLFMVKHLLILREQTSPFRGNMTVKETNVDFSKLKDSAYAFMNHKNRWFALSSTNAFLELITEVPAHISEQTVDSRRQLDIELRDACQVLINIASSNVVLELNDWLKKAEVVTSMGSAEVGGSRCKLSQQPFATPQNLKSVISQAYRKLKEYIPLLRSSLALYVGNRETENILFAPIRKNIELSFDKVGRLLATSANSGQQYYTDEERTIINAPSAQQISLIFSSSTSSSGLSKPSAAAAVDEQQKEAASPLPAAASPQQQQQQAEPTVSSSEKDTSPPTVQKKPSVDKMVHQQKSSPAEAVQGPQQAQPQQQPVTFDLDSDII